MDEKLLIFISAVSKELRLQRKIVAEVLSSLNCTAVIQQEFGTGYGNIRHMLEAKIKPCHGLIQIVGHARGDQVKDAQHPDEVMSYTQFEATFAAREKKPVWYVLIADSWRSPLRSEDGTPLPAEDNDALEDQRAYRRRIEKSPHLFHYVSNDHELKAQILNMKGSLDNLRVQHRVEMDRKHADLHMASVQLASAKTNTDPVEAERLAVGAAKAARVAEPPDLQLAAEALNWAGWKSFEVGDFPSGLAHFAEAAAICDKLDNLLLIVDNRGGRGYGHLKAGDFVRAEPLLRSALEIRSHHFISQTKDILTIAWWLADSLLYQGDHQKAEMVFAKYIPLFEKEFGASASESLGFRCHHANNLNGLQRWEEAEAELRDILKRNRDQILPSADLAAFARKYLVTSLAAQGKSIETHADIAATI